MAYLGNNNLLKAEEDLQKAHTLAGNGKIKIPVAWISFVKMYNNLFFEQIKNIKQQLALVKSKLKSYEQDQKKMYINMFFQINCTLIN